MKKVATLILNRNLPEPTDHLVEHLQKYDGNDTDVFVIEAGSDETRLSQYCTWYVDSEQAKREGLRYCRGMNYGLLQLWSEGRWTDYDAFLLLTNDTELPEQSTVNILCETFDSHPRAGIVSPCSKAWGERLLLTEELTKYFWFIHNNAFFLRRKFIDSIIETQNPTFMDFLFDGSNFRGYLCESELIAKAYANDWSAAITSRVFAEENESYLLQKSDLIKTETYTDNLRLYVDEGKQWMRRKYGFNSRWSMQQYVKSFYDRFFDFHPEYLRYRI